MTADDDLRELRAEVRALRDDIRRLIDIVDRKPQAPSLSALDHKLLGGLLPVIGGRFGSEHFKAADITELHTTPEGAGLRVILDPHGRWSPWRLGKLLARGEGVEVAGLKVVRVGDDRRTGTLWCVVRV